MSQSFVELGIPGIENAEPIGQGGFATVYRAVQPQLNRTVAVKVIRAVDSNPVTTRRFEREALALGSLSEHHGIVTVYSTGQTAANQPYFIMQYCPRGSLQDQLNEQGPLSVADACAAVTQIATSLADAHDQGVLHRDLKPANILIDNAGRYLVADFGIAALTDATAGVSTSVSFTAGYVPPEILQGQPATASGDVYSLGATLYALLRNKMPFAGDNEDQNNALAVMMRLSNDNIEDVRAHGIPDAIASVIERCMAKDPAQRPLMTEIPALVNSALQQSAPASPPGPRFIAPGALPPQPANPVAAPLPVAPATAPTPNAAIPPPGVAPQPAATTTAPDRKGLFTAVGALVVILLAVGGFFALRALFGGDDPSVVAANERAATPETAQVEPTAIPRSESPAVEPTAEVIEAEPTPIVGIESGAGRGDQLVLLQWQEPTTLNPYLGSFSADFLASSIVLEPLARMDPDGLLVPALANEVPVPGDGISPDGTRVTWSLRRDVTWSDGTPFTAADVVFTWQYCSNPDSECTSDSLGEFGGVTQVVADDEFTVTVVFNSGESYPYGPFVGFRSPVIQQAQFQNCVGAAATACTTQNLNPVGTGPYTVTSFSTTAVEYGVNPNYRGISRSEPYFSSVRLEIDGDSESNARSVLEAGDADHASNLIIASAQLNEMATAGRGRVESAFTDNVEHLNLNQTNNRAAGDLQSIFNDGNNPNQFFFDNPRLSEALSRAIDRDALAAAAYGPAGMPTCNMWNVARPPSATTGWCLAQDTARANDILDELGYVDNDNDGVRELPDGTPLEFDLSTSTNATRQVVQGLIAEDWAEIGVRANLQNIEVGEFFFSEEEASIWQFPTEVVMFTNGPIIPEPFAYLSQWGTSSIPTPDNMWAGLNIPRMSNAEYDELLIELSGLAINDPDRAVVAARLDEILTRDVGAVIPLIRRGTVSAFANDIENVGPLNGWDSEFWNIQEWTRDN